MTVTIEDHPNYGKDLLTIQREASFSLKYRFRMTKAAFRMLNGIRKELGLRGLFSLLRNVNRQLAEALETYDFSKVQAKGISETDLKEIIERMLLGQLMVKEMGLEKAKALRNTFSQTIADDHFSRIFPTVKYLEQCEGGFLPNLEKFLAAYSDENGRQGIQEGRIVESSHDLFQLEMDYCAFNEVAEILGDRELCYWTTCITDEFFFPNHAKKAGCQFYRCGTLATGAPVCDFRWERDTNRLRDDKSIQ